jgi:hypothetical protein
VLLAAMRRVGIALLIVIRSLAVRLVASLIFLLSSNDAMAWNPFENKLDLYLCQSQSDARSCSGSCKKNEGLKVEFKVNVEKSEVISIVHKDGKQSGSHAYENCKVVDKTNWSCTDEERNTYSSSQWTKSMANGQFYYWNRFIAYPTQANQFKGGTDEIGGCAK